jgi:hypothetical protein
MRVVTCVEPCVWMVIVDVSEQPLSKLHASTETMLSSAISQRHVRLSVVHGLVTSVDTTAQRITYTPLHDTPTTTPTTPTTTTTTTSDSKSSDTTTSISTTPTTPKSEHINYGQLCIASGGRPQLALRDHPHVIGIRDTQSVIALAARLSSARRVLIIGNGGIALELVHALHRSPTLATRHNLQEIVWCVKDAFLGHTFLDRTASAFLLPVLFPDTDPVLRSSPTNNNTDATATSSTTSVSSSSSSSSSSTTTSPSGASTSTSSVYAPLVIATFTSPSMSSSSVGSTLSSSSSSSTSISSSISNGGIAYGGGALGPNWLDGLRDRVTQRRTKVKENRGEKQIGPNDTGIRTNAKLTLELSTELKSCDINTPPSSTTTTKSESTNGDSDDNDDYWPLRVTLTNGGVYDCDFVVSATGVVPNVDFLPSTLKRGPDGGIAVDDCLRTSVPNVSFAHPCF